MSGAEGWQLSNASILSFAAHRASLDLFAAATMPALRAKSEKLTGYLEFLLQQLIREGYSLQLITPKNEAERGCQLSLLTDAKGKQLFDYLSNNGVICDWREANLPTGQAGVIRLAPTPLYNRFEEVWILANLLRSYSS